MSNITPQVPWLAALNNVQPQPNSNEFHSGPNPLPDVPVNPIPDALPQTNSTPLPVIPQLAPIVPPDTKLPFFFDAAAFNSRAPQPHEPSPPHPQPEPMQPSAAPSVPSPFAGLFAPIEPEPNWTEPNYDSPLYVQPAEPLADSGPNVVSVEPAVAEYPPLVPQQGEEPKPWLLTLTPTESIAYDNHIQEVVKTDPIHAADLLKLKGFKSHHVGLINTVIRAEEHMRCCRLVGTPIGGWEDNYQSRVKQAAQQVSNALARKRKEEGKARFARYQFRARDAWKSAIEERKRILDDQNAIVAHYHEIYTAAKDMSLTDYLEMIDNGDLPDE